MKDARNISLRDLLDTTEDLTKQVQEAKNEAEELEKELTEAEANYYSLRREGKMLRAFASELLSTDDADKIMKIREKYHESLKKLYDKRDKQEEALQKSRSSVKQTLSDMENLVKNTVEKVIQEKGEVPKPLS